MRAGRLDAGRRQTKGPSGRGPRVLRLGVVVCVGLAGCAAPVVPPAEGAAEAYARAIERGDDQALEVLLTERSRRELGKDEVARLLRDNREELRRRSRALLACKEQACESKTRARVRFADGTETSLVVENTAFRLDGAGILPAHPPTPEAALRELAVAVERGSLAALLPLLTRERRAEFSGDLELLGRALAEPDLNRLEVRGDHAEITLAVGLRIVLRREDGAWLIEAIE